MKYILLAFGFLLSMQIRATVLHVGGGQLYSTLEQAANVAVAGDTIRIHEGSHSGGLYIEDLQGEAGAWIVIEAAVGEEVIFDGGNNAWQFTDGAYLEIRGFIFQHQAGNGLNFDDGGTYATPAHHVKFINCVFRDMNASGNNDLLKLSGLDSFEVRQCTFLNGAEGGSGIDMVGCHDGIITECYFENLGSNCVQAKGGTRDIRIEANFFKNGGQRTLNLGGSTGLQFFRPIDAPYEAARLKVYSNVFMGSVAPIAFVGCIESEVVNNTFYLPEKWALRILQETVDTTRFFPCGNNTYRNNILYLDQRVMVDCNIGPNTAPETFTFSNNLWFHVDNPGWAGPVLPAPDVDNLVGDDPLFEDANAENFRITSLSPAIGEGYAVADPVLDYDGVQFNVLRSIGAFEGNPVTAIHFNKAQEMDLILLYPNPANDKIAFKLDCGGKILVEVFSRLGELILRKRMECLNTAGELTLDVKTLPSGVYAVKISDGLKRYSGIFVK